jgi:hypothetical protein
MSDLLKEAIADAKAVRETALANAKMALEEAFTPHLKSMLSAKLAEDEIEEDDNVFEDEHEDEEDEDEQPEEGMYGSPRREDDDDEEDPEEGMHDSPRREDDDDEEEVDESEIVEIDGVKYAPIVSEDEVEEGMHDGEKSPRRDDDDDEDDMDESEELDLEAVIKELEEELEESKEDDEDSVNEEEVVEEEIVTEEDDEDEDKDEVDEQSSSSGIGKGSGVKQPSASDEEDPGKGKVHESVEAIQSELNEYKEAVTFLRDKLHEVNILNAKLLYTNKLFKEYVLSNDQKLKIVETFDRAQTTREIKLVYSTLAESFNGDKAEKKEVVKEFASKKSGGTAPKTKIISEENQVADRFRKLAGIL